MGIKKIKITEDFPVEEGKTYMTKFATKDMFTVMRIVVNKRTNKQISVEGFYNNKTDIICPLDIGRLILEKKEIGDEEICDHCLTPIKVKNYAPIE